VVLELRRIGDARSPAPRLSQHTGSEKSGGRSLASRGRGLDHHRQRRAGGDSYAGASDLSPIAYWQRQRLSITQLPPHDGAYANQWQQRVVLWRTDWRFLPPSRRIHSKQKLSETSRQRLVVRLLAGSIVDRSFQDGFGQFLRLVRRLP
jgi:hypothetical protein